MENNKPMYYLEIQCANESNVEIISSLAQLYPINSIWEEAVSLKIYYDEDFSSADLDTLISMVEPFALSIEKNQQENINWNQLWESNFPVVEVDDFCYIYAAFHDKKEGFKHQLKIAPKMAFGTGHHETTFLMIQHMKNLNLTGKSVMDIGCGTGILAVLAAMEKANPVFGIDNEFPAYENAIEHAEINQVTCAFQHGDIKETPPGPYDVVLANINRSVLLEYAEFIKKTVKDEGTLLLSGILRQDLPQIEEAYASLSLQSIKMRGKWACIQYTKNKY